MRVTQNTRKGLELVSCDSWFAHFSRAGSENPHCSIAPQCRVGSMSRGSGVLGCSVACPYVASCLLNPEEFGWLQRKPVIWFTSQMHNGNNGNHVVVDSIDDSKRKALQQVSPVFTANDRGCGWKILNPPEPNPQRFHERFTQSLHLLLVITGRRDGFFAGRWRDFYFHPKSSSTEEKNSSSDRGDVLPETSS